MNDIGDEIMDKEFERAVAFCYDCKELIGPDWSEDVGAEMAIGDHERHDTEFLEVWTVVLPVPRYGLVRNGE